MQLDIFGELLETMHLAREGGLPPEQASWRLQYSLVDRLASFWDEPDHGIWEVRSGREHFTHSKIMTWGRVRPRYSGCGRVRI
ncbi:glycoside hydrolase family 15 protein [Bradyrhizobium icense]|uniref:glycoside hydrolase family 15 protein n=1 Tax=Bradyrhizobium icense TaxID=1274631 RepID=UPI0030020982